MAEAKIKEAIASAARDGKFGESLTLVELKAGGGEGEAQFASDVVFATARLRGGAGGGEREERVVIKRPQKLAVVRQMTHSDTQFHNEHVMYSEVLPYLERAGVVSDVFPRAVHTHATDGENYEDDMIVVEDLRPLGYRLSEDKVFLDYDHCAHALQALARFHALSYVKKQDDPEEFLRMAGKLRAVRFGDEQNEDGKRFLLNAVRRGVQPLIDAGEHADVLTHFLENTRDPDLLMDQLKTAQGPWAVVCHGDFNRNNIFFKYEESGRVSGVKLFDVATSRYASPAVDLAFLLTMNTTAAVRAAHWDDLLAAYHRTLVQTAPHCRLPTLTDVREEVKNMAVYGYLICSFFIPMMMDDASKNEVEDFSNLPPEVMEEMARNRGGQRCTDILTDVVRDLARLGAFSTNQTPS